MSAGWIILSTVWDFADVQATLNIAISLLGTIGIWTFSRFWYQHNSSKILRNNDVPLSSLFTFSTLGEAWDVALLLKGNLFKSQFIPLLAQGIIVLLVTAMTVLAGPIARYSLQSSTIVRPSELRGLAAADGGGPSQSLVSANVLWNDTIEGLTSAKFPTDQLLDFIPPNEIPWIYEAAEWNSTWAADCVSTEETVLTITGNSSYTIVDPVRAFPAFGATFEPHMLNSSAYRYSVDFCGWVHWDNSSRGIAHDIAFFVLVQTQPTIDDQMNKNNATLHLSLSVLHIHNASLLSTNNLFGTRTTWRSEGQFGNASYTRIECNIARNRTVPDEQLIAWPWTNDTDSIVKAYADYNRNAIGNAGENHRIVPPLPPQDIFRFYQAYQITTSTSNEVYLTRQISVMVTAVQLSTIFLVVAILLVLLIVFTLIRYSVFLVRHKASLGVSCIPDAKLDWMLHTFRNSEHITPDELGLTDREQFKAAAYERVMSGSNARVKARVYSRRASEVTTVQPSTVVFSGDVFAGKPIVEDDREGDTEETTTSSTVKDGDQIAAVVPLVETKSEQSSEPFTP